MFKNHVPGKHFILSQTKAWIKDIRIKVKEDGHINDEKLKTNYETVSLYIVDYRNRNDYEYERIFIDECF